MPHVSPQPLSEKTLNQIYKVLFTTSTSRLVSQTRQEKFFNELLTPTEKVMLGKRIAAIALISRDISPYKVGKLLQLSPTTTGKLCGQIEKGAYKEIIATSALHKKGKIARYLDQLLAPLPRYGTSPATLLKQKLK